MAYIGRQPTVGNFRICDAISVVDGQAAYTMQVGSVNVVPESANNMIVSLNGVIQKPGSSFTVSSSTITFSSNLSTGDVIDFIQILGGVANIGTPSDGTVTTAKLADSSVSLAKLTATGTKDATTFLRGDNTFAEAGADADNYFATSGLSSKDLGVGLHIKTGDSGVTLANTSSDELIIESSGTAGLGIYTGSGGNGVIDFGDSADNNVGRIIYNHSSNIMTFTTGAVERFRAGAEVSVNDGAADTGAAVFKVKGAQNNDVAIFVHKNTSGSETMFRFRDGDQTTCGTIGIDTGGNSVSYNTSSDYRLKENVNYSFDATTRLKQLKPARFNFISNADKTVDGFLAHEVSSIVPEAIQGEKDEMEKYREGDIIPEGSSVGDFKLDDEGNQIPKHQGIDQSKLVPLLVKTIQELEARITQLENA